MKTTYSAARIQPEEHRETLARLWKENLAQEEASDDLVARRMRWFHELNPAGPARTWMGFHGEEREIIGSGSFYPRDLRLAGRALRAGILGDFAVTRAHRVAGAAMSIQREISRGWRDAGVDFLLGFPNHLSFPIFQRAGYKKIGEGRVWVKPLTSGYKLLELAGASVEERRSLAGVIAARIVERAGAALPAERWRALWAPAAGGAPAGRLSGATSAVTEMLLLRAAEAPGGLAVRASTRAVDAVMAAKDAAMLVARGRRVEAEIVDAADARFDALWERADAPFLVGAQTAAYLNWRYAPPHGRRFRFFCLIDRGDRRLLGYAVLSMHKNKVDIVNLFCEDFEGTLDVLLLELCAAMRREGHAAVGMMFVGPASLGERMRALGFFHRALPGDAGSRWLIAHLDAAAPEALRRDLLDVARWFMPDYELDA